MPMNNKLRTIALTVVAGAVALTSQVTAASADGWRHGGHRSYGYAPTYGYHAPVPRDYHYPPRRRDRSGDAVAGAILGVGAVIVGAAIADAIRRDRQRERERDYHPPADEHEPLDE